MTNPALAALGGELFVDPQISASGKSTCAGCHFRALGWAVTDAKSVNDSGKRTSRKSQPLLGIGQQEHPPRGSIEALFVKLFAHDTTSSI